ncbi:hypothetical protein [Nocardioides sp. WS12]|uniref:hypothetical protein n=1 Tax=Nocardioides sp. WS12 TaxID=2486272 RepID=UPI0015F95D1D|nr:hypothetical protein [Nocardioides sp. WS12]
MSAQLPAFDDSGANSSSRSKDQVDRSVPASRQTLQVPPLDRYRTPSVLRAPIVGQRKGTKSAFTERRTGSVVGAARLPLLLELLSDDKLRRTVAQQTRIQIRERGKAKEVDLSDLVEANVRSMQEVRRPAAWARRSTPSGLFIQRAKVLDDETGGQVPGSDDYMVWHESALENGHLIVVAADARFAAFTTQALDLQWSHKGMELQHLPDLIVELRSGETMVIDCRDADYRDDETFIAQVALTASLCREIGWRYELWDRLPKQLDCNLRDLENFVIVETSVGDASRDLSGHCPDGFRTVAGFRAYAQSRLDRGDATAALKHALWCGYVQTDLTCAIQMHTELFPSDEHEPGLVLDGPWREVVVA